jgi:hypothetical protein
MIVGQTILVDGGFRLLTDYFPALEVSAEEAPAVGNLFKERRNHL